MNSKLSSGGRAMKHLNVKLSYRFLQRSIFLLFTVFVIPMMLYNNVSGSLTSEYEVQDQVMQYQSIPIDIKISEDGMYSLIGNVVLQSDETGAEVQITDPFLVGYSVSKMQQEGIWILDAEKGENLIEVLSQAQSVLENTKHSELADQLAIALQHVETAGSYVQAST